MDHVNGSDGLNELDVSLPEKRKIIVYDTTLRDGAQGEGIRFSANDKLLYIEKMAELGIPYVEAGWPGANPRDGELFRQLQRVDIPRVTVAAFGSTCKVGENPEQSAILNGLLASRAKCITIFGKAWDLHVRAVLRTGLDENLRLIRETVAYLKKADREVIFDAEHFFDGFAENPKYALKAVEAALSAGADQIVLCDTNGGSFPYAVAQGVRTVLERFPGTAVGIHAHNDGGMAVANSLVAVETGASHVQGTWNGYGERCGNANLSTLIPWLQLKLGYQAIAPEAMTQITHISRYVSELANVIFEERQPFVGKSAFAHKAGMHVDGVLKNRRTFEHIDPQEVGNERRILISDQAGKANIWERMRRFCPEITKDDPRVEEAMKLIKLKENNGFQFETAEGSLELLLRHVLGLEVKPFALLDYHVWSDPGRGELDSVAVVKVQVEEQVVHIASEGNGPVNALDKALRQALLPFFPFLEETGLIDYKVRVLDGSSGTKAVVRVIVETGLGRETWGTIGVSSNVLKASAQALLDALYIGIERGC